MANIAGVTASVGRGDNSTIVVTWANIGNADTCHEVSFPEYADRSIHVSGTFNGASVVIQGSNNGAVSFATLNDPTETAITISTEAIRAVLENTAFIKPVITGGGGLQSLTVSLLFHLTNPLRQ